MHTDIKKDIGNKIKQLRTVRGLSREQVADKLKMSASNYGNIERGAADISITRLIDIAAIFEITLYDLLGLNEKTVFNFTRTTTTVNTVGINPTSNNVTDVTLHHELDKQQLIIELQQKELAMQQREIENLKIQIAQLQEINGFLKLIKTFTG